MTAKHQSRNGVRAFRPPSRQRREGNKTLLFSLFLSILFHAAAGTVLLYAIRLPRFHVLTLAEADGVTMEMEIADAFGPAFPRPFPRPEVTEKRIEPIRPETRPPTKERREERPNQPASPLEPIINNKIQMAPRPPATQPARKSREPERAIAMPAGLELTIKESAPNPAVASELAVEEQRFAEISPETPPIDAAPSKYTQSELVFGLNQGVTSAFALGYQPQTNLGWAYTPFAEEIILAALALESSSQKQVAAGPPPPRLMRAFRHDSHGPAPEPERETAMPAGLNSAPQKAGVKPAVAVEPTVGEHRFAESPPVAFQGRSTQDQYILGGKATLLVVPVAGPPLRKWDPVDFAIPHLSRSDQPDNRYPTPEPAAARSRALERPERKLPASQALPPLAPVSFIFRLGAEQQLRVLPERARPVPPLSPRHTPESHLRGEYGTVTVLAAIDASGRCRWARIETSSGYSALDNAALEAVQRASYLPFRSDGVAVDTEERFILDFQP